MRSYERRNEEAVAVYDQRLLGRASDVRRLSDECASERASKQCGHLEELYMFLV